MRIKIANTIDAYFETDEDLGDLTGEATSNELRRAIDPDMPDDATEGDSVVWLARKAAPSRVTYGAK